MSIIEVIQAVGVSAGQFFTPIQKIVRNFVKDPNDADQCATQIVLTFADVLKQEIGSQYWLPANWRPLVMLLIATGLTVKAIIGTIGSEFVDYPLFILLLIGLLGYKLDGKILEFVREMFVLGRKEAKKQ